MSLSVSDVSLPAHGEASSGQRPGSARTERERWRHQATLSTAAAAHETAETTEETTIINRISIFKKPSNYSKVILALGFVSCIDDKIEIELSMQNP